MDDRIPEIYVLWHPSCRLGETLARRIHAWLRPGNGLGPQVFYRSVAAPDAVAGGKPVRLPCEGGIPSKEKLDIVLLLLDEHLISDQAWRSWITDLAWLPTETRPVLLPIALDPTAFNVPEPLRKLNFLRPTGLPLPPLEDPGSPATEVVVRSLLKQLTEAMCRLLLGRRDPPGASTRKAADADDGTGPKIRIFLSHAKADGTVPAKRIRDYVYSQTQLAAFYDENDIPFGAPFGGVLEGSLQNEWTAALIAVRSALYESRPWCRFEISKFRRPLPVAEKRNKPNPNRAKHWRLSPTLVVDALEGNSRTRGIPELGNAPLIRWSTEVPEQEEQIVTTLLRDALLAAYHVAVGRRIPDEADRIVLSWQPDPTTLLHIPQVRNSKRMLRVAYPGRGMSGLELDILDEVFPHVTFESFESVFA